MRWFVGFFITSLVSIGIALLLSNLPALNKSYNEARHHEIKSVSTTLDPKLSTENLVDHLIELPINLDIHSVGWSHAILSIDLRLSNEHVHPSLIYNDLIEISHFGLSTMNNVKQVLIRVLETESNNPNHIQYMLAMDAHRDHWSTKQYDRFERSEISANELLRSQFSFTFTPRWEKFILNYL